jgi:hypothetical protein
MADSRDRGHDRDHSIHAATAAAEPSAIDRPGLSTTTKVLISVATALLVVWFFFAWLALDRHVLDAAGESVGTAFALLLLTSVIGALRGHR